MPAFSFTIIFDYLQSIYSMDLIKYSVHFEFSYPLSGVLGEREFALSKEVKSNASFERRNLKLAE